ncbi:MAG: hypothetical protein NVS2B16_01600 [Chloroflexota bacterium]
MVVLLAFVLRVTRTPRLVELARRHADQGQGLVGRMEGHAAMDMSVRGGSFVSRLVSARGYTGVSHLFIMDWAPIWVNLMCGFLAAGALAAWVPESAWQHLCLVGHPSLARIEGPLVSPLVQLGPNAPSVE